MTAWRLVCLGLLATGATAVPDWYKAFEDERVCTGTPGSLCNDEIDTSDLMESTPTKIQELLADRDLPCCDERAGLYCSLDMENEEKWQAGEDGMVLAGPYCQYQAIRIRNGWYSYDLVTYTEPGDGSVNGRPVWTDRTSKHVPYTSLLGADFVAENGGKVQVKQGWSLMATIPGDGMNNLNWNIADRRAPKLEDVLPYGEASLGIRTGHRAVQDYTANNVIDLYCDSPPDEFVSDGGHRGSGGGRSSDVGRATSGKMPTPTSDTWQVRPDQDRAGHLKEVLTYGVALAKALNKLPMTRSKQGLFSGGWHSTTDIDHFRALAEKGEPLYMPSFMSSSLDEIHALEFTHYMYQPGYTASDPDPAFVPVIFAIDSRHGKEVRFWNQWEQEFIFMPNTPFRVQSVVECFNKPGTVDDPWLLQDRAQYEGYPLRGRPGKRGGSIPNNRPEKYFNITLVDMDRHATEPDIFPVQGRCLANSEHRFQDSKSPHQGPVAAPLVPDGTEAADPEILHHDVQRRPNNVLSVMTCTEKMLTRQDGRYWEKGPCPEPFVVPCWHPNVAYEVQMLKAEDESVCDGEPGKPRYQLKWCDGAWPCHPKKTLHHNDGYNGGGIPNNVLSMGRSSEVRSCTETMLSTTDKRSDRYKYGWKEGSCPKPWVVPCWHPNPSSSHKLELLKAKDEDACDGEPGSLVYQTKWCDGPWPCRVKPDRGLFGWVGSLFEQDLAQLQEDVDGLD